MSIDQLVFVGLGGRVVALDRDTGEIVWTSSVRWGTDVSLLLDGDRLIAALSGYLYCLDPRDGRVLWHNPLKGYGMGPSALTSVRGQRAQAGAPPASTVAPTAIQTGF
jgi:outer membrane protein assembly factor BamB